MRPGSRIPRRLLAIAIACCLPVLPASLSQATTIVVDDDIPCSTNSSTCGRGGGQKCCKIQIAICGAVSGDTVSVNPGTYFESIRMRPGVSVISVNGPSVTTIDGTNKPCMPSGDFCNIPTGTGNCSVVLIGSDVLSNTRLDGFKIMGGKGTHVTFGTNPAKVMGGGVLCDGDALITNNTITGNLLSGSDQLWYGGGIATSGVANPGRPTITNNTITGNTAKPPIGTTSNSIGLGGGVYVGKDSVATVENNTISNNEAGDRTPPVGELTQGEGGGVFVYNRMTQGSAVVTRNLITGNTARDSGGGIKIDIYCTTCEHASVLITNNEIRGNLVGLPASTTGEGGGIACYQASVTVANNTIHSNTADLGGGHHKGVQTGGTDVVVDANNIFSSNVSNAAGSGGAIHAISTCHTIKNSDFWLNTPTQIAGACNESTVLGGNGNRQNDPLYKNLGANDFHLDPSSLLIDTGSNSDAPAVDREAVPRPLDGNLDGTIVADIGEYELDRDCDLDGTFNRNDTDDDNDGDPDTADCATCNPNRYHGKAEICNSIDEDCDASVDEGLGQTTCGTGTCQRTVQNCVGGVPQTCNPGTPTTEVCNLLDDDCDGSTDEALGTKTCGLGACRRTVPACINGVTQTCVPGNPSPEVCNGIDDDCNGAIDDDGDADRDGIYNCTDPDDDNDGFLDGVDCAPLVNSVHSAPPGDVGNTVRFASKTSLYWSRVPQANVYNVYRGTIVSGSWSYNHSCFEIESSDEIANDATVPSTSQSYYYLVGARNSCTNGHGTLGNNSAGQPRPLNTPCGSPSADSDFDGVRDIDDNCPIVPNNDQTDSNLNTVGDACEGVDGDHDGVPDASDCAPTNSTAFFTPTEITGVTITGKTSTQANWSKQNIGSGVKYDLATGSTAAAHANNYGPGTCLQNDVILPPVTDTRPAPAAGQGYYYLVRSQNACGTGTYGTTARNQHGTSGGSPCP